LVAGSGEFAAQRGIRQVPAVPRQQEMHAVDRRHRNKVIPVLMPEDPTPDSYLAESPVRYRVQRKPAKSS
jgi:hypothetical protein